MFFNIDVRVYLVNRNLHKPLRYTAIILLLLVSVFFSAGYFIVFQAERQQIKNDMTAIIESGHLESSYVTLELTPQEFKKLNINKDELRINGSLYDIVIRERSGEKIKLVCLLDKKETSLLASLRSIYTELPFAGNSLPHQLISFLQNCFHENAESQGGYFPCLEILLHKECFCYFSPAMEVINPPPVS
ncbi:MAG: hypothetical protein ABIQ74_00050 [Chitinophagales bacterium]